MKTKQKHTTTASRSRRLLPGLILGVTVLTLAGVTAGDAGAKPRLVRERVAETRVERARPHRGPAVEVRAAPAHPRACTVGWWHQARRIEYRHRPYYYHSRLGVCFGGRALGLPLTDAAPRGYLYLDPISGRRFRSVSAFRCYAANYPRRPLMLTVVEIAR